MGSPQRCRWLRLRTCPACQLSCCRSRTSAIGQRTDTWRNSLTDDITTKLAQLPNAFVVARSTSFSFRGSSLVAQEIAAKLGVRYVVEGSLYRIGNTTRINAQLIDATSGAYMWAGQFDADAQDLGQRQRDLMGYVVRGLRVAVLDAEATRLESQPAESLTAADLLLMVEAARNHPPTLEQDALDTQRLEKALQLEPRSVGAMLSLSSVLLRPLLQIGPDEFGRGSSSARQAAGRSGTEYCAGHAARSNRTSSASPGGRAMARGRIPPIASCSVDIPKIFF